MPPRLHPVDRRAMMTTVMEALPMVASWPGRAPANPQVGHSETDVTACDQDGGWAKGIELQVVELPSGEGMQIAIARPDEGGSRPAVLILHGTHGFAQEYVSLARAFAEAGFVAIAACWFKGSSGLGVRYITPIACPARTPDLTTAGSDDAQARVAALVAAARSLPGVDGGKVVLFGHSRGGGAALNHALTGGTAEAVIVNSTGYPPEVTARAASLRTPTLILHGEADSPADGGSDVTDVTRARAFAAAARAGGRVQAHYFPRAGHNAIFADRSVRGEALTRAARFIRQWAG